MSLNRRKFLQLNIKSAFVVSTGNIFSPFNSDLFKYIPASSLSCRFAIASDGHYGQPGTEYDIRHNQMIEWINAEKKNRGVDFTVINGDLFHNDVAFLEPVKKKWEGLSMPYYVSHGNHDETSEANWKRVWDQPWHYAFDHSDTGIIILNTADDKGNYICPDVEWAKVQLQQYAFKKQLFIFMHITPFKWTKGGIDCPAIVELFNHQKNLKAIFHGHDHDQDDVKKHKGKHYFFDSHIAGDWGTTYNGYRIVEVLKSGQVLTYQMNPVKNIHVNDKSMG